MRGLSGTVALGSVTRGPYASWTGTTSKLGVPVPNHRSGSWTTWGRPSVRSSSTRPSFVLFSEGRWGSLTGPLRLLITPVVQSSPHTVDNRVRGSRKTHSLTSPNRTGHPSFRKDLLLLIWSKVSSACPILRHLPGKLPLYWVESTLTFRSRFRFLESVHCNLCWTLEVRLKGRGCWTLQTWVKSPRWISWKGAVYGWMSWVRSSGVYSATERCIKKKFVIYSLFPWK